MPRRCIDDKPMHTIPLQIRFSDIDALGHVNNAVYLNFLELARVSFWKSLFVMKNDIDFPFILARAEIDFRHPLHLSDSANISVRTGRIGNASWDFQYIIRSENENLVIMEAKTVQVYFDYSVRKSVMIPEAMRSVLNKSAAETS